LKKNHPQRKSWHPTFEEVDFENLWERNREQNEVEKLQDKFTKEFENLNKILEEKSNKFTEQNKENMKSILSPLQEIHLFEKVEDTYTRKHRLPCSFAPTDSRFTRNECPNE
jgi:DNA anti-recombination protein RmuC